MSGHSKWAQIKRQKAVADKKKGQIFSKLSREITIATAGGADPGTNFKLRLVLDRAKTAGLTKDVIERAIKRGTGESQEGQIEEMTYEGYGPFGTAFLIEAATDNKNRLSQEIKHIFSKHAGNLGTQGSVAWQFMTKGQILIPFPISPPLQGGGEEGVQELSLLAIDMGAEDVRSSKEGVEIYCAPLDLGKIKAALIQKGLTIAQAQIIKESTQGVDLTEEQKKQVDALIAELEENEDVIAVHTSANL